ncbi:MAG: dTDP-4-dehydrorhamnose 3,5-epimerase [bacterium]
MTRLDCTELAIQGVMLIKPRIFHDHRGLFMETYHHEKYAEAGIAGSFVQDNRSQSVSGVIRGLHYQLAHPQAKLILAISGSIFDVAVDIRHGSPTFGKWVGEILSDENHHQLYVPTGFAHGFCVLSGKADVLYKCTDLYHPGDDHGVIWNDPDIGIKWPVVDPVLSAKDAALPGLPGIPPGSLPQF